MPDAVIVDSRFARQLAAYGGALKEIRADDLAAHVINALVVSAQGLDA